MGPLLYNVIIVIIVSIVGIVAFLEWQIYSLNCGDSLPASKFKRAWNSRVYRNPVKASEI